MGRIYEVITRMLEAFIRAVTIGPSRFPKTGSTRPHLECGRAFMRESSLRMRPAAQN